MFIPKQIAKAGKALFGRKKRTSETGEHGNNSPRSSVQSDDMSRHSIDSQSSHVQEPVPNIDLMRPVDLDFSGSSKAKQGTVYSARSTSDSVRNVVTLPPLLATQTGPASFRAITSPSVSRQNSSRGTPTEGPNPWPTHPGQDLLRSAEGPKLTVITTPSPLLQTHENHFPPTDAVNPISTGVKLVMRRDTKEELRIVSVALKQAGKMERIQNALLEILAEKNVFPVIEEKCVSLAFNLNRDNIYAALADKRLFNWDTCQMEDIEDFTKPSCVSFSFLANTALLRGKNPSLCVLRDSIKGLEEVKQIGSGGVNNQVANAVLKDIMAEISRIASFKYHSMLFSQRDGKECAKFMCSTRQKMIEDWLNFIKNRVTNRMQAMEIKSRIADSRQLLSMQKHDMDSLHEEEETDDGMAKSDSEQE